MYKVPNEYFMRLHHPRPRFKSKIEDVLLFMAEEICSIGTLPNNEFKERLNQAIRFFPGNIGIKEKTINNWRTEISSLLGLIVYPDSTTSKPSTLSKVLESKQDLVQFFRYFSFKFQYPGGHQKPHEAATLIELGVRFKPAQYIISLLRAGNNITDKSFGVTKAEITHCIFNDLRVTRDNRCVKETAKILLSHRVKKLEYDTKGDIVRYAGDILDYMVLANIIEYRINGLYYLKTHEPEIIESFIRSEEYFNGYNDLYDMPKVTPAMVSEANNKWFSYVNSGISENMFQADLTELLLNSELTIETANFTEGDTKSESDTMASAIAHLENKKSQYGKLRTKDIGDVGEAIVIQHEKVRLTKLNRDDLARKVVKYPENLSAGFDIKSYEGVGEIGRFIEVKTTVSKNKLNLKRFSMTPNEWGSAETHKLTYYIYRLMISNGRMTMFIIKDPVGMYKADKIVMTPRNGVDITYSDESGIYSKVLA